MSDWIYVGAILFGAFSLLIEADRNYRTTLGNSPFPYHAILENVELENLCTPREWMSGFLFYSLLYLLAYAIILSSTELFLLVRNANLAELEVGAHTDFVGPLADPMELADSTFGKPIFVSAFLIAFLSVGAMKPVETYMRALAHRLAGVPRGVYKVLERLQTVEYLKLNAKYPSPLLQKFDRLTKPAAFKKVSDQYNEDIQAQLSTIDCLSPSVTAGFSRLHFPLTHFDAFKDVPEQLAREIEDVEELIDNIQPNEAALKALHEKAVLASNSAKAVFAVFYVRNNHAIKNTDPRSTIAKIEKLIARGYRTELNSFAMSMFIGVLVSLAVAFSTYHWRSAYTVDDRPSLAEAQIASAWEDTAPERKMTLNKDARVSITLSEGTEADVTLPKGDDAVQTLPDKESKVTPLPEATPAKVEFPTDGTEIIDLPAMSQVTIRQLPELDRTPRAGLPVVEVDGMPGVVLPVGTVAVTMLSEDLDVDAKVPEEAKANINLEDGAPATVNVGKGAPAVVTLKAGDEITITFVDDTPAQAKPDEPSTDAAGRARRDATDTDLDDLHVHPHRDGRGQTSHRRRRGHRCVPGMCGRRSRGQVGLADRSICADRFLVILGHLAAGAYGLRHHRRHHLLSRSSGGSELVETLVIQAHPIPAPAVDERFPGVDRCFRPVIGLRDPADLGIELQCHPKTGDRSLPTQLGLFRLASAALHAAQHHGADPDGQA